MAQAGGEGGLGSGWVGGAHLLRSSKQQIGDLLGVETHFPTLYSPADYEPNFSKGLSRGFN